MSSTRHKRNTKSAKKTKAKEKKVKTKSTTTRIEEEKIKDIPAGDYEMEIDDNSSSSS